MSMTWQVSSLEWSLKLKALGVDQISPTYAYYFNAGKCSGALVDNQMYSDVEDDFRERKLVAAFTVSELLVAIPRIIEGKTQSDTSYLRIFADECIEWCVHHSGINSSLYHDNSDDPNLANVLSGMLYNLVKDGLISLEEVNERLKGVRG